MDNTKIETRDSSPDLTEKTLKSEVSYSGHFLKVQRDEVELPNHKKTIREYIQHPGASLIVPVFDDFETMILEQFRYPLGRTFIEFPAGKIDPGENPDQTAKRELFEETGLRAMKWTLLTHIHPVIGYSNEVIHIFIAQNLKQEERPTHYEEFLKPRKVSFQYLFQMAQENRLTDVKTQLALFWANKYLSGDWVKK